MNEQDLIELGFTKEYGEDFYYYIYELSNSHCLISNDNEESDKWWVEFFEVDTVRFTKKEDLKTLINLITKNGKNISSL
jgi:hypothetical protein